MKRIILLIFTLAVISFVAVGCTKTTTVVPTTTEAPTTTETPTTTIHTLDYGTLVPAKDPTCTEDGNIAYYYCEETGKYYNSDFEEVDTVVIPALGHIEQYQVITPSTETEEGTCLVTCAREGCDFEETRTILRLPVVSADGYTISWPEVTNAEGYKVVIDDEEYDLGTVREYNIPASSIGSTIEVHAYATGYCDGVTSVAINEGVTNLQADKNADFESSQSTFVVDTTNSWGSTYPYGNWSGTAYSIINDNGNMCAKLQALGWYPQTLVMKKDVSSSLLNAGTYTVTVDVKLGGAIHSRDDNGTTKYDTLDLVMVYDGGIVTATTLDLLSTCNSDGWTTVRYQLVVPEGLTGDYAQFDFYYWPEVTLDNNYILVDNIKVTQEGSAANIDTIAGGDFEIFNIENFQNNAWYLDNTLLIEPSAIGSGIITEGENHAFKLYTTSACAEFDLNGDTIAPAGLYKLTLSVKLGPDADYLDSFGFMGWAQTSSGIVKIVQDSDFTGLDGLSKDEYTTISVYFLSSGAIDASWINLFFYAYLHNDVAAQQSTDNYIVIDNIVIEKMYIQSHEHVYSYAITTAPTTTAEGVMTATCTVEGCNASFTRKILMVPDCSVSGDQLVWNAVTNATGYKIIVDNGDPIDLGDVRTYTINPGSSYYVIAYTTNEEYYGESKTALIEPECVLSGNLQAEKNYDFESAITLAAGSGWSAYPYGNWGSTSENDSYGPAYIIQDSSGNACLKIQAIAWWPHGVAVWKDLSTNLLTAGTYKVIMDVKLGEPIHTSGSGETLKYDTLTCVLFYNGGQINATSGNIISCTDAGWTRVEYVFSYASDLTDYVQLAMYYWPESTIDNNYVLIDNIKVVAADDATETNLDTKGYGDFEDFYKPTSNVWFGGQFSVLAETSSVGSSIILDGDNHVLKVYNSSSSDNCFIDVTGNALELRQVGTYKVTIKVKTSNVANLGLGFCYYTANGKMGGDVNFSSEEMSKVNNEGWTEITVYYQITEESNAEWANMFFWVYDHNTTNDPSVYTLIDNVVIQRVTGYTIN